MAHTSFFKEGISEITNTVDTDTGEVVQRTVKKHYYKAGDKESFFLGYSCLIGAFMEMSQAEIRIFGYCLRYANKDTNKFDISKKIRLDMAEVTGLHERTILNTLPLLVEKLLLYKHDSGLYQVNPRYAFEGSTRDRDNELQILFSLGCKEC